MLLNASKENYQTLNIEEVSERRCCSTNLNSPCSGEDKYRISILTASFFFVLITFLVNLHMNINDTDTTYYCHVNPTISYPTIDDAGYVINETNSCEPCGALYTCLYMQSQKIVGNCCSTPCMYNGIEVSSLQSVIHLYNWTLHMGCTISGKNSRYYLNTTCQYWDVACQKATFDYVQKFPIVQVCNLNDIQTDCNTNVWSFSLTLLLIVSVALFSAVISYTMYCFAKYRPGII